MGLKKTRNRKNTKSSIFWILWLSQISTPPGGSEKTAARLVGTALAVGGGGESAPHHPVLTSLDPLLFIHTSSSSFTIYDSCMNINHHSCHLDFQLQVVYGHWVRTHSPHWNGMCSPPTSITPKKQPQSSRALCPFFFFLIHTTRCCHLPACCSLHIIPKRAPYMKSPWGHRSMSLLFQAQARGRLL